MQTVFDVVGMYPILGATVDRGNEGITDVVLCVFHMNPLVGDIVGAMEVGKTVSDFSDIIKRLEQNIYKKTTTGATRKVLTPEQIEEITLEGVRKIELEVNRRMISRTSIQPLNPNQPPYDPNSDNDLLLYHVNQLNSINQNPEIWKSAFEEEEENFVLDLLGWYDLKKVAKDVINGDIGLDTIIAGASIIPYGKILKVPKAAKIAKGEEKVTDDVKTGTRNNKPDPNGESGSNTTETVSEGGSNLNITKMDLDDLPKNVQDAFKKYDDAGWKGNVSGQTPGTNAGRRWGNREAQLPTADANGNQITYREFDVNNYNGVSRDSERFIIGSDGSVWYTDSHYGQGKSLNGIDDFVQIK